MQYDIIIIGAGPAGYVAAIRAGQAGLRTLVIEKQYIGGMCLNWGCIPTKALLESARLYHRMQSASEFGINISQPGLITFDWEKARQRAMGIRDKMVKGVEFLWKKNSVELISGNAVIKNASEVEVNGQTFATRNLVIATGSKPSPLALETQLPVLEIEQMMLQDNIPSMPLVYGNGSVALEMYQFLEMIGKKPVWIAPFEPILPGLDDYINSFIVRQAAKRGGRLIHNTEWHLEDNFVIQGENRYEVDAIINCSRRRAILPEMQISPALAEGFIKVDADYRTSVPNVYAIGDVNGISKLAHVASAQGLSLVNQLLGEAVKLPAKIYPINIYSEPEIAQAGQTEQELSRAGTAYQVNDFNLSANAKALIDGYNEGIMRILSEPKYGQVLGVQIIAPNATDMIGEACAVMELEGTVYDIAATIHAHPTVSEIYREAGLAAIGQPLNK